MPLNPRAMAVSLPFSFLRHGLGVTSSLRLWVGLHHRSDSAASLKRLLEAPPFSFSFVVRGDGPVLVAVSSTFKKRLLALAKAGGLPVKQYKNERLLTPLRGRPEFNKLMR